jgi:hypothetical protein
MPLNRGGMLPFWIKLESCNVRFSRRVDQIREIFLSMG